MTNHKSFILASIITLSSFGLFEPFELLFLFNNNKIILANPKIINKPPGSYLKEIFNDVEKQVVLGNIENNYLAIEKYIIENYSQTYP